ncbi:MAG TPA: DUF3881 family protein [Blastocatellia bacterium]|nr:DUF3881 family protein [Blastocatellia bacterium]
MSGNHSSNTDFFSGAVMAELFDAIGFQVADEASYNHLVERAELSGERSFVHRRDATLHGRCWRLGGGLEIWSILYENRVGLYYADCRPAFRSRYVHLIHPWELIEYDEDGEAIIHGGIPGGSRVVFELQNLTEIRPNAFRELHLHVALAGLAYTAQAEPLPHDPRLLKPRFELAERLPEFADDACENDYVIAGRVLAWREITNPETRLRLVWMYMDVGEMRLEILINRHALRGPLLMGGWVTATVWLQGHVLQDSEISARYEGVDWEYETSDFWTRLRRGN